MFMACMHIRTNVFTTMHRHTSAVTAMRSKQTHKCTCTRDVHGMHAHANERLYGTSEPPENRGKWSWGGPPRTLINGIYVWPTCLRSPWILTWRSAAARTATQHNERPPFNDGSGKGGPVPFICGRFPPPPEPRTRPASGTRDDQGSVFIERRPL